MKKLNYKQFLEKLNISLDYTYLLDKDTISKLDKNKEAFINNLLLVPNVSDKSRDDLLKMNEMPFKRELLFYLLTYDKCILFSSKQKLNIKNHN